MDGEWVMLLKLLYQIDSTSQLTVIMVGLNVSHDFVSTSHVVDRQLELKIMESVTIIAIRLIENKKRFFSFILKA